MRFVPGPDLPTGGKIVGLDGIREAYETGRGIFRTRATARVEKITPRRSGIVVTELPYGVGPEKVIEKIAELVRSKKLQGIADVKDLTDRAKGLRLVIEVKNGFNPEAMLEQLYRLTPMEDSFGINNVALVDGQPRTLGLKEMLEVYLGHRFDVVRRRTDLPPQKAADRLHLVEGLLVAIVDIDEVIQLIRSSDDAAAARGRLMDGLRPVRDPGQLHPRHAAAPADQVLPHRAGEGAGGAARDDRGADRDPRFGRPAARDGVDELAEVAKTFGTPRRTVLLESSGVQASATATPLEVTDDPCWVLLSSTGLLARTLDAEPLPVTGGRPPTTTYRRRCAAAPAARSGP